MLLLGVLLLISPLLCQVSVYFGPATCEQIGAKWVPDIYLIPGVVFLRYFYCGPCLTASLLKEPTYPGSPDMFEYWKCTKCSSGLTTNAKMSPDMSLAAENSANLKVTLKSYFDFTPGCYPPAPSMNPPAEFGGNVAPSDLEAFFTQFNMYHNFIKVVNAGKCLMIKIRDTVQGPGQNLTCTQCSYGYEPTMVPKKIWVQKNNVNGKLVDAEMWDVADQCVPKTITPPVNNFTTTNCPSCFCSRCPDCNVTASSNCTSGHTWSDQLRCFIIFLIITISSIF